MSIDINVTFDPIPDLPAEAYTALRGLKGDQGIQGIQGVQGNDGFSPTATVEKVGGTATITITDVNGTTTATVSDGVSSVTDVTVDGTSVVDDGVAEIDLTGKADVSSLATVATTGDYDDLIDKPTLFSGDYDDLTNKPSLFSGDYEDLTNKPTIPTVPTNVSAFVNDAGYLTSYTETDPTVPSWAKQASKPSYTAGEVGAVPTSRTVNGKALSSNITLTASDVGAPTYTAGTGISITNGVISLDLAQAEGEDY